jgi:hypothetical protein
MAELVDASDSKSGIGNNVQVRFLFWALSRSLTGFTFSETRVHDGFSLGVPIAAGVERLSGRA